MCQYAFFARRVTTNGLAAAFHWYQHRNRLGRDHMEDSYGFFVTLARCSANLIGMGSRSSTGRAWKWGNDQVFTVSISFILLQLSRSPLFATDQIHRCSHV